MEDAPVKKLALLLAAMACAVLWAATGQAIICPTCCVACRLPQTHTWPTDPAPCDAGHSLQACIDSANPGDTVQIATNGPITGASVLIHESLSLRAASSFQPKFSDVGIAVSLGGTDANASQGIDIEGLLDVDGISIADDSAGPVTARVVNDSVRSSSEFMISVFGGSETGPCTFEVSDNTIDVPGVSHTFGILINPGNAAWSGRVADNVITVEDGGSGGIIASPQHGGTLDIDVIDNLVSGTSFEGGIAFDQTGATSTTARILDNLVVGQSRSDFTPFGAVALASSSGLLTATVANNTLVAGAYGITASSSTTGSVAGLVANNIVSGNSPLGMDIDLSVAATLANRNNLVFGNYSDVFAPGSGTVTADPLFVDAPYGDYHLKPGSPAIDAGYDGAAPATDIDGGPITDLDGNPRIQGARVDIGAYETAPEPGEALARATALVLLALLARRRSRPLRSSCRRLLIPTMD